MIPASIMTPLREIARAGGDGAEGLPDVRPLRSLLGALVRDHDSSQALGALRKACSDAELGPGLLAYATRICLHTRWAPALSDVGILPAHGLTTEVRERLLERLLPSQRSLDDLIEILGDALPSRRASLWLDALPEAELSSLADLFGQLPGSARLAVQRGVLRAMTLLAHRLAASGEEPHLQRYWRDEGPAPESPFLAQAEQVVAFAGARARWSRDAMSEWSMPCDPTPAREELAKCRSEIHRARDRMPERGATVHATYELERMTDIIDRLEALLALFGIDRDQARAARGQLVRTLLAARRDMEPITPLLGRGVRLLAAEIVSHAGRAGGHYITRTPAEYAYIWRSAAGAGALVALAAVAKLGAASLHAPVVVEAALFSLNYAACFVAVQLLGLTIATKQPAMTSATLATAVAEEGHDHARLVDTVIQLSRTQLAAILGNVLVAMPVAYALSFLASEIAGAPLANEAKAAQLIRDVHPLRSIAVVHAAIAGVWLSLAGVCAGYVANACVARHMKARIARSPLLASFRDSGRAERLATWMVTHAGPIAGSVVLGVLLGSTGAVGQMLGLPLDIRHISFASANFGLAAHAAPLGGDDIAWSLFGIALIGFVNLSMSFGLSLGLAVRARGVRSPPLLRGIGHALRHDFAAFFLPVGRTARPRTPENEVPSASVSDVTSQRPPSAP